MTTTDNDFNLFNTSKRRFQTRPEDVLESLKVFSLQRESKPATINDYKSWEQKLVSIDVVKLMFGSWEDACRKAGIPLPLKKDQYTDQELIEHFESVWRHFGQRPSVGNLQTYNKKFGTTVNRDVYRRRWGDFKVFGARFAAYKLGQISFAELVKRPVKMKRELISARLRAEVLNRDEYTCRDCGASPRHAKETKLHIHHIIPVSKGGKTEAGNLVTNCSDCNLGKSDVILEENATQ